MDKPMPAGSAINISKWLEGSHFNNFHWVLFFLGFGSFALDGYCLLVYGAAVPLLLESFKINPAQAGIIGSYALIGMGIGALVFGTLADRIGRKKTIMLCIAIFSVGMVLSGLANDPVTFGIFRAITGFGVGGCMPNMVALATEYAPARSRATMISMMLSGIQVGGILAALAGLWLFTPFGWRSVFIAGIIPLLVLVLYFKYLPDSPVDLLKHDRIDQLKSLLRRARPDETLADDAVLQTGMAGGTSRAPIAAIFRDGRAFSTVMLWLVYFLNLYTIYGFSIWLPKLVMSQGYSLASGLTGLLTLSTASIIGSYVAGIVADRYLGSRRTLVVFYVLAFVSIVSTGYVTSFWALMVCVSLAGAGFNGAQNSLNGYVAPYYPPEMRSTAMGFCYGIGRLGAILGPAITGFMMSLQLSYQATLLAIAIPGLIPAIAIFAVRDQYNFARQVAAQQAQS